MEAQEKGNVTIREYMDMQITFVNKELQHIRDKIAHEKELGTQASKSLTKALELQAEKYEQRLTQLNHEAQRLALMIPRIEFDIVVDGLNKRLNELTNWKNKQEGLHSRAQWIAIAAMVLSIILYFFKN